LRSRLAEGKGGREKDTGNHSSRSHSLGRNQEEREFSITVNQAQPGSGRTCGVSPYKQGEEKDGRGRPAWLVMRVGAGQKAS